MWDNIRMSIPVGNSNIISIAESQDDYEFKGSKKGSTIHTFGVSSMKVKVVDNKWCNVFGSLPKLIQGHSIAPLTKSGYQDAVELLSDSLDIDISKGIISKYEIGTSLSMKYPAGLYLELVTHYRNDTPVSTHNSSKLFGKSNQLSFYDKGLEMMRKRVSIPDEYKKQNLLKIEYRKDKDVGDRWGRSNRRPMYASDLYNDNELRRAMQEYKKAISCCNISKSFHCLNGSEIRKKVNQFVREYA